MSGGGDISHDLKKEKSLEAPLLINLGLRVTMLSNEL